MKAEAARANRLEEEVVTAVSRGADTLPYVMYEFKRGEKRLARQALYRALDKGKILMTIDRRLLLPPA